MFNATSSRQIHALVFGTVLSSGLVAPHVHAQETATIPSSLSSLYETTARNTDDCPHQTSPPPAIDLSETIQPGHTTPSALKVPQPAQGGEQLGGCGLVLSSPQPIALADITASSWIVAHVDSGEIIAAKDPHGRYRPASIIKILLALVVSKELDMDQVLTAKKAHAEAEGSAVGIIAGERYTVKDLLHGLMLNSGNDAAALLAHGLGGVPAALTKMNALAAQLGATDTRAASVSGLDKPGMSTSAYDMMLFTNAILNDTELVSIMRKDSYQFPAQAAKKIPGKPTPKRATFWIGNDNRLLSELPGAILGKTGFTDDSRHTFAGAAKLGKHTLIAVVLDATKFPKSGWEQAKILLNYGFTRAQNPAFTPVGSIVDGPASPSATPAVSSVTANTVHTQSPKESSSTLWPAALGGTILLGAAALLVARARKSR